MVVFTGVRDGFDNNIALEGDQTGTALHFEHDTFRQTMTKSSLKRQLLKPKWHMHSSPTWFAGGNREDIGRTRMENSFHVQQVIFVAFLSPTFALGRH